MFVCLKQNRYGGGGGGGGGGGRGRYGGRDYRMTENQSNSRFQRHKYDAHSNRRSGAGGYGGGAGGGAGAPEQGYQAASWD